MMESTEGVPRKVIDSGHEVECNGEESTSYNGIIE
jgi:hypothetical protein